MKKGLKITIIILIVLSILGYGVFRVFYGPSVSMKDKREIKKYAENYLTKKYGEHKFKVTGIRYEYDMTTLFDYSNPTGYWVDFKSDIVPHSWITINGLNPDVYKVDSDYFIESYYFPEKDGYDVYKIMDNMEPRKDLERLLLDELRKEFDSNIYEMDCDTIILDIPEDYGKIPSLEELNTNTSLYRITQFDYKVSTAIEDTEKYEKGLKSYIKNKYNSSSDIYFNLNDTSVSVFLVY